jgi:hypothetical protein
VAVQDELAYVLTEAEHPLLVVVDVSDPARAVEVGSLDPVVGRRGLLGTHVRRIAVDGAHAYLSQQVVAWSLATPPGSTAVEELLVLDTTQPREPRAVGRYQVDAGLSVTDMAPMGDRIAITVADTTEGGWYADADPAAAGGLWVLDRGEMGWPTAVGRHSGLAHADHVLAEGAHAYVAQTQRHGPAGRASGTLYALEVDHRTPWPTGEYDWGAVTAMSWVSPTRIVAAVAGDAEHYPRVILIDKSSPPLRLGVAGSAWLASTDVVDSAAADGHAYLLSWPLPGSDAARVHVLEVSSGPVPITVATVDLPARYGLPGVLALVSNSLYVGSQMGLHVVDVAEPRRPRIAGSVPGLAVDRLAAGRGVVYAAHGGGAVEASIAVVDATDPDRPTVLADVAIDRPGMPPRPEARSATAMTWDADRLLIAFDDGTVCLYDATLPIAPVLLAGLQLSSRAKDIAVDGCRAVLAAGDGGVLLLALDGGVLPTMRERAFLPAARTS